MNSSADLFFSSVVCFGVQSNKKKIIFDYQLVGVSVGTVDFAQIQALASSLHLSADYLYAGNVIGEMGLLTDSVRNASVSCETTCQVRNFQVWT